MFRTSLYPFQLPQSGRLPMCLNKLHDRPWPGATPALAWWWLSREISRRPWLRILFPGVERSHEQISQNLTPSKKIKKWRDKLQDQSITEMESITISARVSLQRSESCSNGRMDSEWSWIMAYVESVETWPTQRLGATWVPWVPWVSGFERFI